MVRGLYLHIPFCSVKCFYCDFTAFSGRRASIGRYLAALEKEAGLLPRLEISTLYVGGGTPSELSAGDLSRLLDFVGRTCGPVGALRESTLEANPDGLGEEKLDALGRGGLSRLSLGLQTAEERLLKLAGRRHSFADFLRAYRSARRRGFSVNVDLMFGLPTQTREESRRSVEIVSALEPDHLSLYGLQVEDRTLFAKREVEVDEDLARLQWEDALEILARFGYRHYEVSNFAKPGHESVHNENYWSDGEYIGLGCGASGHFGGERYSNIDRLDDYCSAVEAGRRPVEGRESLSGKAKLGETILLGLRRLEGLAPAPEMEAAFSAELEFLAGRRWIERAGARIRLTRDGLFLANRVFQEFVAPFRAQEARA